MSDPVIITWNVTNWITIFLMAVLGFALVSLATTAWKNHQSKSAAQ